MQEKYEAERLELERNRFELKKKNDELNHQNTVFNQTLLLDEQILKLTDKLCDDSLSEEVKSMICKQISSLIDRQELIQKQMSILQDRFGSNSENNNKES